MKSIQTIWKTNLKDVDFHLSDADDVSILIGADIPELHICYDVRQGSKNQPIALLTLLGWVLMGGIDSKATQINSNQISVNNKKPWEFHWKLLENTLRALQNMLTLVYCHEMK